MGVVPVLSFPICQAAFGILQVVLKIPDCFLYSIHHVAFG
jgi:hypothetical protein